MTGPAPGPRGEGRLAAGCAVGMAIASAASWLRLLVERSLALDTHTGPHLAASALAGAGLLATGICSLRLAPRAHRLSWRALIAWAVALQALAALALPLTSTDAYSALAQGALQQAGLSAYRHGPAALGASPLLDLVPPRWRAVPSPYGPLFLQLMGAIFAVGERIAASPWGGLVAYKATLLTSTLVALAIAAWHLRRGPEGREVFALLALGPLLPWEIVGQGHNDGFVLLATVGFLAAAAAGRDGLAAGAVAAGMAFKVVLAPLLALHLLLVGRRSMARAAWVAAVALALLAAAYATSWRDFAQRGLAAALGSEEARHAHSLADLACLVLEGLGRPAASRVAYRACSTASALACGAALLWAASRSRTLPQLGRGYLVLLLTLYLTAAWFQPWYVSWALPLLLVEPDPRWRRLLASFAVVTVVQWGLPLDPLTTVAGDAWVAWRAWRLLRDARTAPVPALA